MPQESSFIRQTRRPTFLREWACPDEVVRGPLPLLFISRGIRNRSPFTEGTLSGQTPTQRVPAIGRTAMRSEDLMSPDLLSEMVLLGFGELIFVSLLLFLMAALSRA